ncbi:MAG: hypothetical protein V4543_01295 [Bacteroidota bacterium]
MLSYFIVRLFPAWLGFWLMTASGLAVSAITYGLYYLLTRLADMVSGLKPGLRIAGFIIGFAAILAAWLFSVAFIFSFGYLL